MRLTLAGMTKKWSSARSTFWPRAAITFASSRSRCEDELERLLARRPEGIFINPFERGEMGPDLFPSRL
jgi:hypothetical protein